MRLVPSALLFGWTRRTTTRLHPPRARWIRQQLLLLHTIMASSTVATSMEPRLQQLQDIIGTDAGGRGMQSLICPGDLAQAARCLAGPPSSKGTVVILSGFPCCVTQTPPTETDGPPGTFAIARAAAALGWSRVVVAVDDCNRAVFQAVRVDSCIYN